MVITPRYVAVLCTAVRLLRVVRFVSVSAVVSVILSGCSQLPFSSSKDASLLTPITVTANRKDVPDNIARILGKPSDLWGRIAWGLSWDRDFPAVNEEIEHILAQPLFFDVLSERALPALPWIVAELERLELPIELAIVPIVESMLDPWAYSSQRAAGLWQISPATASHYGLEVNWWYDARLDIPVATEFALSYLVELQQEFDGDWALALAAYNSGRGRVNRALLTARKMKAPDDYWRLKLPQETQRYVPRILAIAEIIAHPARFNLSLPQLDGTFTYQAVATNGQIEVEKVAELAGMEPAVLRKNNPAHLRWATAPSASSVFWVPLDTAEHLAGKLATLDPSERVRWSHYEVAPGDTLSAIALRFDTNVALIRSTNALDSSFIRAGQTLLIPNGKHGNGLGSRSQREWPPVRRASNRFHNVRQGESLWSIANKYGTTVVELAGLNGIDPAAYLQLGQRLKLR